jgi:DNA-binding transcriptional LysR family regulator
MVEEGLGVALLPKVSTEREFALGILAAVDLANVSMPRRQISLIFRKNRKQTRATQAFLAQITELYKVAIPDGALTGVA